MLGLGALAEAVGIFVVVGAESFCVGRRHNGRGGRRVLLGLNFGLPLQFLHLGALVLEPDLDNAHAEAGLFGQCFSHFTTRLRADLERGLELASLARRQDRPRPLRTPATVARSIVLVAR